MILGEMATITLVITKSCSFVFIVVVIIAIILGIVVEGGGNPSVPCAFFFGDSLSDNGNNNDLDTKAKVNYEPYGIDYPDGPSGRFSNGKNLPDFLGELLGFEKPIPPFARARGQEILKGVNYASGGSGILDETGQQQGGRISMNYQLWNHEKIVGQFGKMLKTEKQAKEHLKKCFYMVNMGSNDYLNNYFLPQSPQKTNYSPQQYADILTQQYSKQLRTLHRHGARKIVIFSIGYVGCIPEFLSKDEKNASFPKCDESKNNDSQYFNDRLKPMVDSLNRELPDAKFILVNTRTVYKVDPETSGIKFANASCCPVTEMGLCLPHKSTCTDRKAYAFWDNFHPTQSLCRIVAKRIYNAQFPSDFYPLGTNIHRLMQTQN